MENRDCIFCKIVKGEIPADKIYEDENVFVFLDINPVNYGHALLIPKEHYKNLYDLPDETLRNIAPIIKKIALAVKQGVNAKGINIGMNNEGPAGQIVPHAHFHIIPRFSNDGLRHWPGKTYAEGEAEKIADEIKKNL